jgi:hypothetical protein
MYTQSDLESLQAARYILRFEHRWSTYAQARLPNGKQCRPSNQLATKFSIEGAIIRASPGCVAPIRLLHLLDTICIEQGMAERCSDLTTSAHTLGSSLCLMRQSFVYSPVSRSTLNLLATKKRCVRPWRGRQPAEPLGGFRAFTLSAAWLPATPGCGHTPAPFL